MYLLREEDIDADGKQAFYWYQKSAKQGDAQAQYNLGMLYEYGHGTAVDEEQVLYWYQKSAEQGFEQAQLDLGLYWIEKSCENGNQRAKRIWEKL